MGDLMNDDEWRLVRLDRLGLKEDPFKLSADPRYLYLGPEHLAVYRQAQGVISRRRGLALITGDMGMGKSSLARRLYDVYASEETMDICLHPHGGLQVRHGCRAPDLADAWGFRRSVPSSARWRGWRNSWRMPTPPTTMWLYCWMTPN